MDYLGCVLDETMLFETMVLGVVEEPNPDWIALHKKIGF